MPDAVLKRQDDRISFSGGFTHRHRRQQTRAGAVSDIFVTVTERQIAPGETGVLSIYRAYGIRDSIHS